MGGRWMKPEVYPLLGAMSFVTSMCIFQLTRNLLLNPDVRFSFITFFLTFIHLLISFDTIQLLAFISFDVFDLLHVVESRRIIGGWEWWRVKRKGSCMQSTDSESTSGLGLLKSCLLLTASSPNITKQTPNENYKLQDSVPICIYCIYIYTYAYCLYRMRHIISTQTAVVFHLKILPI